jgi:hypothetical protein
MALFVVVSNELEEEILPFTFSNVAITFSNDNATFAQFEYNTNQI